MKINLLRRTSVKYRRAEVIRRINYIVLIVVAGLFLSSILIISSRYIYLQIRANSLKQSIADLQKTYFSRSDEVADYARVSGVVSRLTAIAASRFKYREFLHAVYDFLPAGVSLTSIDFTKEGILLESVRFDSLTSYDLFLARIRDQSGNPGFLFKAISQKTLVRDNLGRYQANLEIKI